MAIHQPYFFAHVRDVLFDGRLSGPQVDGLTGLLAWYDTQNPTTPDPRHIDDRMFAYILATSFHETARTMAPVIEYGGESYLKAKPYFPWHGRGHVQLTWQTNYEKQDAKLGLEGRLLANPDLALDPTVSLQILVGGMTDGDFTGKKLADFFTSTRTNWYDARTIVNGHDRAKQIADYAVAFLNALTHT